MARLGLYGLALVFVCAGVFGCGGSSVPPPEERPGLKERQERQKEKKQGAYMKPDEK